jgi:hypothetical protein
MSAGSMRSIQYLLAFSLDAILRDMVEDGRRLDR